MNTKLLWAETFGLEKKNHFDKNDRLYPIPCTSEPQ